MKVYVLMEVHSRPEIYGDSEVLGAYSTREKAEQACEELRDGIEYSLGSEVMDVSDLYDLVINEFELE